MFAFCRPSVSVLFVTADTHSSLYCGFLLSHLWMERLRVQSGRDYSRDVRTRCLRITVFFLAFGAGLIVLCFRSIATVDTIEPLKVSIDPWTIVLRPQPNTSDEMLKVLLPNDTWAEVSQLEKYDRGQMIKVLRTAAREASGERALSITFLFAALKEDYQVNRSKLLTALGDCHLHESPHNCTEIISEYLIELARRGDSSLFTPLFGVADMSDGCLTECLAVFYSDALHQHPKEFVAALTPLPSESQNLVCEFASWEMSDEEFRQAKRSLNATGRHNSRLVSTARRCAVALQRGKTAADAN